MIQTMRRVRVARRPSRRRVLWILIALAACAPTWAGSARSAGARASETSRPDDVRRLEEVPIQGEIAMPQVWFVTARELPRLRDGVPFLLSPLSAELARRRPLGLESWNRADWALPGVLPGVVGRTPTAPGDPPSPEAKP